MSFLRNSYFSFLGGLLPAVALLVTIPLIVSRLGTDVYGVFVLVTSIVGYFSVLDVNATAGSVKYLAEYHARGDGERAADVVCFGALVYLLIGIVGCALLSVYADYLVTHVFNVSPEWREDAIQALRIAALAFLVTQLQMYLQSIPQALQRYDISGKLDATFGVLAPLVTIAVVLLGGGLVAIILARLVLAVINLLLILRIVVRLIPSLRLRLPRGETARKVGSFSAFAYLQRIASVTYSNADKLLIGAHDTMRSLSSYVIPYTLANRVAGLVYRLIHVMLPAASALAAGGEHERLRRVYIDATRYFLFANVCVCLLLSLFATELLHYWIGKALGDRAPLVLAIVACTLIADSMTNIPSLVNDGLGHPRYTGFFALLRVGLGLTAAWLAIGRYGFMGVAWSQLAVSWVMSPIFLMFLHGRSLPWRLVDVVREAFGPNLALFAVGILLASLRLGSAPLSLPAFAGGVLALALGLAFYGWAVVLSPVHRAMLAARLRRRPAQTHGGALE